MNQGIEKLKAHWNSNPMETMAIGTLVVGALAKIVDTLSSIRSKNAYARQVDRKGRR